jgi:SAM-dependent methyltransferase
VFDNRMAPLDGLEMSYRVGQCAQCGFCYAYELPLPETYEKYYRLLSKYDQPLSQVSIRAVDQARMAKTLELCRPHLPPDALISDIGCGFGALLKAFKAAGFSRLHGIDPAPASAITAKDLLGLENIHTGSLRDAINQLPLADTDLLCLTGVAEHLPCLSNDFGCLLRELPERAMVLIEVPALERFLSPPGEAHGEFSLEHIQYFSAETLTGLMANFGFSPQALSLCEFLGCTDSLFGLFSRRSEAGILPAHAIDSLDDYLNYSAGTLKNCLQKIVDRNTPFAIFGAGSHTARLLPQLEQLGLASQILAIVDNNPNLRGKKLGDFVIKPGDFLATLPGCTVLVSSFNAQSAIARELAGRHPTLLLYDLDG